MISTNNYLASGFNYDIKDVVNESRLIEIIPIREPVKLDPCAIFYIGKMELLLDQGSVLAAICECLDIFEPS